MYRSSASEIRTRESNYNYNWREIFVFYQWVWWVWWFFIQFLYLLYSIIPLHPKFMKGRWIWCYTEILGKFLIGVRSFLGYLFSGFRILFWFHVCLIGGRGFSLSLLILLEFNMFSSVWIIFKLVPMLVNQMQMIEQTSGMHDINCST